MKSSMTNQDKQRGIAAVIFAVLLLAIIGFAAMALDIGLLYSQRTEIQRAADAGALAGAFTFVVDPVSPQPNTANQHAVAAAVNNTIDNTAVNAGEVSVNVDLANRRVTVNIAHPENTFLARALGTSQVTINVTAVAEAATTPSGAYCTKPWFLPNTILDTTQKPCDACQSGTKLFIKNGQITSYAQGLINSNNNQFTIKPGSPQGALAPSQFYPFQLMGSESASQYRDEIETCAPLAISCGKSYLLANGNMSGPTYQGTTALIGNPPNYTYIAPGQYQNVATGATTDTSPSLVLMPVWDDCNAPNFCPNNHMQGNNQSATIVGFAMVFVESAGSQGNQASVTGRLIAVTPCGGSGGGGTAPAPFALPVRLVRTN